MSPCVLVPAPKTPLVWNWDGVKEEFRVWGRVGPPRSRLRGRHASRDLTAPPLPRASSGTVRVAVTQPMHWSRVSLIVAVPAGSESVAVSLSDFGGYGQFVPTPIGNEILILL